jgi:hypothetical protein
MGRVTRGIPLSVVGFLINPLTKDFDVSGEAFYFFQDSENYIGWYGKEDFRPGTTG